MPFSLTVQEIRNLCGATYFNRGRSYQLQGRVLVAEWDENIRTLFGEVDGSGRNVYEQEIAFSPAQRNRIHGYCSCPIGHNCKHVAAVLLEWIEQELSAPIRPAARQTISPLQLWQQQTTQLLQSKSTNQYPVPGRPCLLHLLQPNKSDNHQGVLLKTVRSRHLKRGGWGKATPYNLYELTSYYNSSGEATELDKEIAQLIYSQSNFSYAQPQLEGDIGLLVLLRLLRSGRCFLQTPDSPPLTIGPSRDATFEWQNDQEKTRLTIGLEKCSDWLLIPTTPTWYLDLKNYQCGPIAQPLPAPLFRALRNLPTVTSDQLSDLSYYLLQTAPPNSIPLPVELNIHQLDQPPTPRLLLHSVAGPTGSRHHLARLRFDYGPLSLPPLLINDQETVLLRHAGEDWQIKRHIQPEMDALQILTEHNFIAAEPPLGIAEELNLLFAVNSLEASALSWKQFLSELPLLEATGWKIEIDSSFELNFDRVETLQADIEESAHGWFEVGLNIEHEGHKLQLLPLVAQWLESQQPDRPLLVNLGASRWLEIPVSVLEPVVSTLVELFQDPQLSANGQLKLPRPQAHGLVELEKLLTEGGCRFNWQGGKKLRQLAKKLQNFQGIEIAPIPEGLNAELRNYQLQGLSWLQFLRGYDFNGVLADDMGLGKTIQTLAHLLLEKEAGRLQHPALIVAPTSVLSNWWREAKRFTPGLRCLILHGPQRAEQFEKLGSFDLIITSYALLSRDLEQHLKYRYHSLILDEAQAIKNPHAQSTRAACAIKAAHRFCLTGTPLQNHLGELWSLFQFLMPGFLSSQKRFNQLFRTPIEKHHDQSRQQQLQQRLAPFVLRRDKSQVVQELPLKTMMVREVELNGAQAKLYESLRIAMTAKIGKLLQKKGLKNSHIEILDALLKLRQACCDPRLVKLESARKVKHSAKLEVLLDMLEELLDEGRKVLIFSQFTSMLSLIEEELVARSIDYSKLTGRTRNRDSAIATFQDGVAPVFLISLKAGGVGLNLTAADTVIHYDPWWNPAVENQATDRAHRIGQQKPVFVYKLVAKGTLEEKILQLQEKKQRLAEGVYKKSDAEGSLPGMNAEDILSLLAPIE